MKPYNIKKIVILAGLVLVFVFTGVYSVKSWKFQGSLGILREKSSLTVLDVTLSDVAHSGSFGPDNYRNIPVVGFDFLSLKRPVAIDSITLRRKNIAGIALESEFMLVDRDSNAIISDTKSFKGNTLIFDNLNLLIVAKRTKTIVVYANILDTAAVSPYFFSVSIECKKDIKTSSGVVLVNDGGPNPFDIFNGPNTDRSVVITVESGGKPSDILDLPSYGEFYTIKEALDNIEAVHADGSTISGTDLVRTILDDGYNPNDSISNIDAFIRSHLDDYTFPLKSHRAFITNVVNGLWIEHNRIYPWSFSNYSFEEIRNLFIENELVYPEDSVQGGIGHLPRGDIPRMRNQTTYDEYHELGRDVTERGIYKQLKLGRAIIFGAETHEEAALALIKWTSKNFLHAYYDYGWDDVYEGGRPSDLEQVYEQRIIGCQIPTLMLEAFFHSMNIPARRIQVDTHGVTYLPTMNKFIHGDHIADFVLVPPEELLLSREEIEQIGNQSISYRNIIQDRYDDNPAQYFVTNTELLRDNDALYLFTEYISSVDGDLFADARAQVVPEFNLVYDSENRTVYSTNQNPILGLEELNTDSR